MLKAIRSKIDDMKTIRVLCERAEFHALQDQQSEPGAEHFLLAAFDLPDGTARLVFERAGVDPDALKDAIERQYSDALHSLGLSVSASEEPPLPAGSGAYRAAPSGQQFMQELSAGRRNHGPLLGAHVVGTVARMPHGVAARALRALGADPAVLISAADRIVEAH